MKPLNLLFFNQQVQTCAVTRITREIHCQSASSSYLLTRLPGVLNCLFRGYVIPTPAVFSHVCIQNRSSASHSYAVQSHLESIAFRPEFEYICIISHCIQKLFSMEWMKIWHFGYPLRRLQEMGICSRATSGWDSLFHVFGKKKKKE